jgi:hypothetical protein
LQELVHADWRINIGEVTCEMGISYVSAQTNLTEELWMRQVRAKFDLRLLTVDQVECCKIKASGLFENSTQDVVMLGKVGTGDES